MNDRINESELLALVEDELAPHDADALLAKLDAEQPGLRELLESLREDRRVLRSLPDTPMPIDFLAELEPQLSRPLLMEQPGSYRRRHRRKGSPWRVLRYAVAAVVLIAAGVVTWVMVDDLPGLPLESGETLLAEGSETTDDATGNLLTPIPEKLISAPVFAHASSTSEGGAVHHGRPLPQDALVAEVVAEVTSRASGETVVPVTAPFAVVVAGSPVEAMETALVALLDRPQDSPSTLTDLALVRNFSFAEANALLAHWQYDPGLDEHPPAVADIGDRGEELVRVAVRPSVDMARRLEHIRRQQREEDERWFSKQLLGAEELAPSYEMQLDFSELGATHTITVRASELPGLLHELYFRQQGTSLRVLADANAAAEISDQSPLQRWATDFPHVRAFLKEAQAGAGDPLLLIPLVIQTDGE